MTNSVSGFRLSPIICLMLGILLLAGCKQKKTYKPTSQNPSPMVESIRPHLRVSGGDCEGKRIEFVFQEKAAQLYIPGCYQADLETHLIIHFHGLPDVSEYAICNDSNKVLVTVNGGSGSSSYEKLFSEPGNFEKLTERVRGELKIPKLTSVTLSAWSAGYGAVRALIPQHEKSIDNIILLDGLHTSYVPENLVLHKGGELDSAKLEVFFRFAKKAIDGEKQMLLTHTSIFPGTFASTTECTDYLIRKLNLERKAVLKPGPLGMQQLGELQAGDLHILSFAGNTAPDHIDHLHGLHYFIHLLHFNK